uniref:Putative ovule protein n=1 Tax=Solanum chacoense TaxID=4108 RepID=A0A0V0HBX1_SOLCH
MESYQQMERQVLTHCCSSASCIVLQYIVTTVNRQVERNQSVGVSNPPLSTFLHLNTRLLSRSRFKFITCV